jgi:hypothetical protein
MSIDEILNFIDDEGYLEKKDKQKTNFPKGLVRIFTYNTKDIFESNDCTNDHLLAIDKRVKFVKVDQSVYLDDEQDDDVG